MIIFSNESKSRPVRRYPFSMMVHDDAMREMFLMKLLDIKVSF